MAWHCAASKEVGEMMDDVIKALLGGDAKAEDTIQTQPLKFSSIAAFGAGLTALVAIVIGVIKLVINQEFTDVQLIAVVALLAVCVLAFAIAAAGDAVARAYSSAWVVPAKKDSSEPTAKPALADLGTSLENLGTAVQEGLVDSPKVFTPVLGDIVTAIHDHGNAPPSATPQGGSDRLVFADGYEIDLKEVAEDFEGLVKRLHEAGQSP
jgi:hypothetical protein